MDEQGTIAALIARIDFLETRVVALEDKAFPAGGPSQEAITARGEALRQQAMQAQLARRDEPFI